MPCSHSHKSVHSECSQEGINFIQVSLPFWQMSFWLAVRLSICPSTGLRGQLYSATLPLKLDHGSVNVSNKSHACNYVSMPFTQCWFHWCLFIKEPPYLPARDYFCFIQNLALYTTFWFKKIILQLQNSELLVDLQEIITIYQGICTSLALYY